MQPDVPESSLALRRLVAFALVGATLMALLLWSTDWLGSQKWRITTCSDRHPAEYCGGWDD